MSQSSPGTGTSLLNASLLMMLTKLGMLTEAEIHAVLLELKEKDLLEQLLDVILEGCVR